MPSGCFNSRSREGSDGGLNGVYLLLAFQFTLPRGERPGMRLNTCSRLILFQFTLPRGERLEAVGVDYGVSEVSIHAPARGATL